jgi:2'-5' RNA ligase
LLDRAAAAVRLPPIDIVLDHSLGFRTRDSNCFVLGASKETASQLRHLKDVLGVGLQAQGISAPKNSGFAPHLTLFYGTSACPPPEEIEPIRWRADRFVLIRSLIGQGRHIVEGEWLLEGDPR